MDALSHALITYLLFSASSLSPLIPFAVLGAVIPDADIVFPIISDRIPSLYLFTHGGIAHSFSGAIALSLLAYSAVVLVAIAGIVPPSVIAVTGIIGFAAILAGSFLHLAIDLLAFPGIPLFAPFQDRKITLGILPGPSLLLAMMAVGVVLTTLLRLAPFASALRFYGYVVLAYFSIRIFMFLFADARLPGRKVPNINPFQWLVIEEDDTSYHISTYTVFKGYSSEITFNKFHDTNAGEVERTTRFFEARRFLFHSYCVTAERIGSILILADPVREKGYLFYPPKFKRIAVPAGK